MLMFTKYGQEVETAIAPDAKGRSVVVRPRTCSRCGGAGGADKWHHTGWTCFDCGGKGVNGTERFTLYTPEAFVKYTVTRDKRRAKLNAKREAEAEARRIAEEDRRKERSEEFERTVRPLIEPFIPFIYGNEDDSDRERNEQIGTAYDINLITDIIDSIHRTYTVSDKQIEAMTKAKARIEAKVTAIEGSTFLPGEPGDRIEIDVIVNRRIKIEVDDYSRRMFGQPYRYLMTDLEGRALTWKTTSPSVPDAGRVRIKAMIKGFGEFRGVKQTELTRVKDVNEVREHLVFDRDGEQIINVYGFRKVTKKDIATLFDLYPNINIIAQGENTIRRGTK